MSAGLALPFPSSPNLTRSLFIFTSFHCFLVSSEISAPARKSDKGESPENNRGATEYGSDIPEDASGKMFSLTDVSVARGTKLESHTSLSTKGSCVGLVHVSLHSPKADPGSFWPLSTRRGLGLEDGGQGVADHPFIASALPQARSPESPGQLRGVWGCLLPKPLLSCPPTREAAEKGSPTLCMRATAKLLCLYLEYLR